MPESVRLQGDGSLRQGIVDFVSTLFSVYTDRTGLDDYQQANEVLEDWETIIKAAELNIPRFYAERGAPLTDTKMSEEAYQQIDKDWTTDKIYVNTLAKSIGQRSAGMRNSKDLSARLAGVQTSLDKLYDTGAELQGHIDKMIDRMYEMRHEVRKRKRRQ